jgi:Uri superfamily endonuclease
LDHFINSIENKNSKSVKHHLNLLKDFGEEDCDVKSLQTSTTTEAEE